MKGFYQLLVAVAVIGGGVLWYVSQRTPSPASPVAAPGGPLPVAAADGFRGYTLGTASAPIEITEYSDFECPFCASFATVQMPVIREQLIATGKVRWRFRDYPLPSHAYSRYAALAAQCAGEQSKFWEMHDQYAGRIQASVEEGAALGVKGTPSFFVNGRPFGGRATSDDIKALADSLSKKSHK